MNSDFYDVIVPKEWKKEFLAKFMEFLVKTRCCMGTKEFKEASMLSNDEIIDYYLTEYLPNLSEEEK